jgi:NAD/NADP transhydrogenase beta subunit
VYAAAAVAVQVQVKFWVAPPAIVALAGLAAAQLAVVGLRVGVTAVTLALAPPLFLSARVRVTAWPVLAVVGNAVSVGASTAAACTVTAAPVTTGLTLVPLTESVAATVAP